MTEWRNRILGSGAEPPDQLLANPANFRIHPKHQQDALAGVLSEVGWVQEVIVNQRTGHLIDGHLRVMLALREGAPFVPCKYVDLSPEEEALILATFDPIAALAVTDNAKLEALLGEVSTGEAAIQAMIDEMAQAAGIVPGLEPGDGGDDFDTTPAEGPTRTAVGDLWLIDGGKHRLLVGDCTDPANVARLMGGERAKLIYTDPPYGVDYDGGTKVREKLAGDASPDIYGDFLPVLNSVVDERAPLYLWHADKASMPVLQALLANGWECRAQIIWNKNLAQFGALTAQYKQKHEPCWYAHRRGVAPYWYGPTNEVTVWDCDRAVTNEYHPTQKPVALAERAMNNSSTHRDIALDLFLGSGATLIAAHRTGRRCYGMEIEPRYADVILRRAEAEHLTCEKVS